MALISCLECGNKVSSNAETCPNCGNPLKGCDFSCDTLRYEVSDGAFLFPTILVCTGSVCCRSGYLWLNMSISSESRRIEMLKMVKDLKQWVDLINQKKTKCPLCFDLQGIIDGFDVREGTRGWAFGYLFIFGILEQIAEKAKQYPNFNPSKDGNKSYEQWRTSLS